MDIEQAFNDLGVDAVVGTKLMDILGLTSSDFVDPARFMRFKDIIGYFKDVPDSGYILNKITTGKLVDKLDHVWGYTDLARQKQSLKQEATALNKQSETISRFDEENPFAMGELIKKSNELADRSREIDEQMYAYEK